ncbi:MAG TPA: oxygenase MpaB family protein [Rugosimonospora sp.]|nr:oxygenase MpaB family protein [Rugosimonospora sp.]
MRRLTRRDLFPTDEHAREFCADLYAGDPVAETFVDDVFFGPPGGAQAEPGSGGAEHPQRRHGHQHGRAMLDLALRSGVDAVPDAPASMRRLFAEFEQRPEWVDPDLVEQGAAIWRRWGTMLFSVAGATTLEIYTEAAVALPLSLTGGYAGDNALRRFLETCRFWMDVSEPGALLRPGSAGRTTAMLVRVMHVSVRRRVAAHEEWDAQRWGLPISQGYMLLTLIGGSVAPALALWLLGYQTTPAEMRALLHFQRYLGYLLGVQPRWYPASIGECLQILAMTIVARSYDAGPHGAELIESFPAGFAPRPETVGWGRVRAAYNFRIYSAYAALYMAPRTRRRYAMPRAWPWLALPLARIPLVTGLELARRAVPGVERLVERVQCWHRENWYRVQMAGRQAAFDASSGLRR